LGGSSIGFGARDIEENWPGVVVQLLFLANGTVRMKELVGDVGEDRGATGRDSAFGHQNEETPEKFAKVHTRGACGEFR